MMMLIMEQVNRIMKHFGYVLVETEELDELTNKIQSLEDYIEIGG